MNAHVLKYFHPVIPSKSLGQKPVEITLAGRTFVMFRNAEGIPSALDNQCPHRRAPLSKGWVRPDGRIACPYHGWSFDSDGRGSSPTSPNLQHCDTRSYQVAERFGFLWMAERSTPVSSFPNIDQTGFEFAGTVSSVFQASLELSLDNISEDEHFASVHRTFGWNYAGASEVIVMTTRFDDRTEVSYRGPQRPTLWALWGGLRDGDRFHNEWYTRFEPVHTVYTFGWEDPNSSAQRPITTRAAVFLVPETANCTRLHMFLFLRISPSLQSCFAKILHRLARHIAARELKRDAYIIRHVARSPSSLDGMRLTRFDEALIHNRKLLSIRYWGQSAHFAGGSNEVSDG